MAWPAIVACLIGCQSAAFQASTLPPEFLAAEQKSSESINLAKIAAPGTSAAVIAPGDLLEITVATGRDDESKKPILVRVANEGTVDVPIIGSAPVAGFEEYDASENIANLAIRRGMYLHPLVTVEIKKKAVNRITVLGAVQEPGVYELPKGGSDVVSALAAAGGMDEKASFEVEIVRQPDNYGEASTKAGLGAAAAPRHSEVNLAAHQRLAQPSVQKNFSAQPQVVRLDLRQGQVFNPADHRLDDRDIVRVIPRKEEYIHVTGLVKEPGQFELPHEQQIRLLDAVALAGGLDSTVADKAFVIRQAPGRREPIIVQASLSKAKQNGRENLLIAPGDTVSIEQTPATALVDALTRFFRLSFGVASNTVF